MKLPNIVKKILHFTPVQRNFWVLAGIMGLAIYWLNHFSNLPGDDARIRLLIGLVTLVFCGAILLFSMLTLFPAYGLFRFKKRLLSDGTPAKLLQLHLPPQQPQYGKVPVTIEASGVAKPFLGALQARVLFENRPPGLPIQLKSKFRDADGIKGRRATRELQLPNIRKYKIEGIVLYFEDFFRLFSLPYFEASDRSLITTPTEEAGAEIRISTEKANEVVLKVYQHKKARGELFDYKKYAPGDDIRRILWKNYARTRELMVRIPDRNLPYVSHVNLLVSFFDGSDSQDLELKNYLLDMYKQRIRQIADSILEQEFSVQLFTDQTSGQVISEYDAIVRGISSSIWQTAQSPQDFLRSNSHRLRGAANIFVMSSLCPVELWDELATTRRDLSLCYFNMKQPLAERSGPPFWKKLLLVDIYDPFEQARRSLQARKVEGYIRNNSEEIEKRLETTRAVTV